MSDFAPAAEVASTRDAVERLKANMRLTIKGKDDVIEQTLVCLLAGGHLLIEDLPGVGKTTLAYSLARSMDCAFSRIQFTSDLLPTDVTGVSIYDETVKEFVFKSGPVFANIVLADEINRASPKTQAALLEAMEERQVTVDSQTHTLASPFMVMATQNPIELEGTYPLPEAQLDRFLMRLRIGYPDKDAELAILDAHNEGRLSPEALRPVISPGEVAHWSEALSAVHVAPELKRYLVDLADASRNHRDLLLGVSPRGVLALQRAARTFAASLGRSYVVPDDIKALAPSVLEHRVVLSADAQLRGVAASAIVAALLDAVSVPVQRVSTP